MYACCSSLCNGKMWLINCQTHPLAFVIVPVYHTYVSDLNTINSPNSELPLFGKVRNAVLGLLVRRSDEQFHLRQLARLSGVSLGAVQREVVALVTMGVLSREESGRHVYFQARTDCPYFHELRQLLVKISGPLATLRSILDPIQKDILIALVFGSTASGEAGNQSDVDLLIISEHLTVRDLGGKIREATVNMGRELSLNLYRPADWAERVHSGHPFARAIQEKPHLFLIGDEHEFGRLAETRLAKATPNRRHRNRQTARSRRTGSAGQR